MKAGLILQPQFTIAFAKLSGIPRNVTKMVTWKKFKLELFEEAKVFEEIKAELIKEYSEKDENGEIVFLSGDAQKGGQPKFIVEKIPEFEMKMNDLFSQDLKAVPVKLLLSKLPETLELTEQEFDLLQDLLEDDTIATPPVEVLPAL